MPDRNLHHIVDVTVGDDESAYDRLRREIRVRVNDKAACLLVDVVTHILDAS